MTLGLVLISLEVTHDMAVLPPSLPITFQGDLFTEGAGTLTSFLLPILMANRFSILLLKAMPSPSDPCRIVRV